MNRLRLLPLLFFANLATLATAAAPPAAGSPGGVEVLEAIPFRCAEPWTHHWSAERPEVEAGTIVVARVDPSALRPKAAASPLLMVGEEIAEIVNPGNADGIVIAIVPAPAGWTAGTTPSLAGREVFLSEPALADQVDAAGRKSRRAAARVAASASNGAFFSSNHAWNSSWALW